jgi:DNA-binding transcriptional LysR family regulator
MELRHLRYFVAVAEELNFSRAAGRLYVAQPAISRQIADLEAEVGTPLLQRNTRRVLLTAAGHAFLADARHLLADADAATERARRVARGEAGELAVAFLGAPTMRFFPTLVKEYRDRFPAVTLRMQEMTPERQLEAFAAGRLNLGFTRPLPGDGFGGLKEETVLEENLRAVVPVRHPLAPRESVALGELAHHPWVLLARGEAVGLHDHILAACRGAGFSPKVVNSPNLMATVLTLVAAEQGVSVVPESVRNLRTADVRFLPLPPAPGPVPLVMAWRAEDDSPTLGAFRDLVRERRDAIRSGFAPSP